MFLLLSYETNVVSFEAMLAEKCCKNVQARWQKNEAFMLVDDNLFWMSPSLLTQLAWQLEEESGAVDHAVFISLRVARDVN